MHQEKLIQEQQHKKAAKEQKKCKKKKAYIKASCSAYLVLKGALTYSS